MRNLSMSSKIAASLVKELRDRTGKGFVDCKKALVEAKADIDEAEKLLRISLGGKAEKKASRVTAEGRVDCLLNEDGTRGVILELNCETDFVARNENFIQFHNSLNAFAIAADGELDAESIMQAENEDGVSFEEARIKLVSEIGENISFRRLQKIEAVCMGRYVHPDNRTAVLVAFDRKPTNDDLLKDIAMHITAINPLAVSSDQLSSDVVERERDIFTQQAAESGKPAEIVEKMVQGRLRKFYAESCLEEQPFVKNPDQKVGQLLLDNKTKVLTFVRYKVGEGIDKKVVSFADEVAAQLESAK
jgi:elongation factor Ts